MEEIKPESLEDYLKLEFKKAWITAAWLEGCLCLRCHPEGVWAVWENVPKSWCPICGKDPLMHGPALPEIVPIKEKLKMQGSKASAIWFDELFGKEQNES
jgi:hypothetical protein